MKDGEEKYDRKAHLERIRVRAEELSSEASRLATIEGSPNNKILMELLKALEKVLWDLG